MAKAKKPNEIREEMRKQMAAKYKQDVEHWKKLAHDREVMDALLERLRKHCHPVRHWFYGHYHHSWQADIDGIRYTMLKEMEMKELR